MTYLEFLGIVLVPPVAAILLLERHRLSSRLRWQIPLLATVAAAYTAPWDRQLIVDGVWSYPPAQVIGATVLEVPLEEYLFYVLQVVLVGLVAASVARRLGERWG